MSKHFESGQSILEYTLLLGAIIAIIVTVLLGTGGIKEKMQTAYEKAGTAIENTANDLDEGIFEGTPE